MNQKNDRNNRANQLNPNNDAYWQSRGKSKRPKDWVAGGRREHVKSEQERLLPVNRWYE